MYIIFKINHVRAPFVPKICYWSVMSVHHDVDLSSIQWRAHNGHGRAAA